MRLARPKPAAMANHQPHFGAKHGHMIADRLGVRWADADVDERDPCATLGHQMIGRHLVPPPFAGGDLRLRIGQVVPLVDARRAPTML